MLKHLLFAVALAASAAEETTQPKPPRREALADAETLALRNLLLEYQLAVAKVCSAHGIKLDVCIVDPQSGTVAERPAPAQLKETKK